MASYGNILTIFGADNQKINTVINALNQNQSSFEIIESTFYFQSNSKVNTADIIRDLKSLNIQFIVYHNHDPVGSIVWYKDFSTNEVQKIKSNLQLD